MNEKETEIIKVLSNKINAIIALYEKTKTERDALHEKVMLIEKELNQKTEQLHISQNKHDQIKAARQLTTAGEEDTTETKEKINELVRDIDKCIFLLNN